MTAFPPFLVFSLHPVTKSSLNKEVYRKLIWDHFGVLAFFFSLKSYLLPSTREFSFYHHRTISGLSTNSNSYSCFSSIRTYSWYCHYSPFLSPTSSFVLLYSFCIELKSHQLALRLFNWKKKHTSLLDFLLTSSMFYIFPCSCGCLNYCLTNESGDFSSSFKIIPTFIFSLEH